MKSTEAINLALHEHMSNNDLSVAMGLGINDPKRIFGTSIGLLEKFGPQRVIEPPTSENALTGICLGLGHCGFSVCLTHQRFDFALLSLDQLINSISKWKFMFSRDDDHISLVIRLIVGRGWGQGPTHSQSYHSFLASIPGLNVVYPYHPESFYSAIAGGLSAKDPTVVIEHRWLHNSTSNKSIDEFDSNYVFSPHPSLLSSGDSVSILTYGYIVPDVLRLITYLKDYNISVDLLVLTNLSSIDLSIIKLSILKTNNLILAEPFSFESSVLSTIGSNLLLDREIRAKLAGFQILSLPNEHESTSFFQTKERYITINSFISALNSMLKVQIPQVTSSVFHDIPGKWFTGPF